MTNKSIPRVAGDPESFTGKVQTFVPSVEAPMTPLLECRCCDTMQIDL
jgi:hypothetical protein